MDELSEDSIVFDPLGSSDLITNLQIIRDVEALAERLPTLEGFVVCIGNQHGLARVRVGEFLSGRGLVPISVLSQQAMLDSTLHIGRGCVVMPGVIVQKFCTIGDYAILNTGACIDHECHLGDGVHVMGQVALAGRVSIGNCATIGTNATILPDLSVGAGAYVGAGSVVIQDVAEASVVVGNPARWLRQTSQQFEAFTLTALATAIARRA
ncbi:hypothetical protein M3N55_10740 [Roseibaca sp. V10]|uniref:Uncharacterized protein n=2 Tax=Roseinatronobacter domitianus TaxID=2940293 RepID=A0ABT0M2Y2_9RHOB|nr:hypothetical protein [Roseibaca domitiana]